MNSRIWAIVTVLAAGGGSQSPAFAMGYDSLDCPELAGRRIAYFTNNGFCDPAKPADANTSCAPVTAGAEAQLPEPDRTQVQMILRTEARKQCPAAK
jgi:hypothetical protein